jgi:hypothetical protein
VAPADAPFAHTRRVLDVLGAHGRRSSSLLLVLSLHLLLPGCGGSDDGIPGASGGAAGSNGGDVCPDDLPGRAACDDGVPSYEREVAPIIEQRCNACHYPNNLQTSAVWTDYDAVYARRRTIQSRIYSCVMPPQEAPPLARAERSVLLEWLVCGAPEE